MTNPKCFLQFRFYPMSAIPWSIRDNYALFAFTTEVDALDQLLKVEQIAYIIQKLSLLHTTIATSKSTLCELNLSKDLTCSDCGNVMPIGTSCPHCGRPQLFPNVQCATNQIERGKLDKAYSISCENRRDSELSGRFEELCKASNAVFNCAVLRLNRQIASGTDVFATYYKLEQLRLRYGKGNNPDWAKLRPQAEIELLGSEQYIDGLHYACLSLDGVGITSYGECSVQLAESMVSHRTSCFSGNTAVVYFEKGSFSDCLRSDWKNRHKLCVAFCESRVDNAKEEAELPACLVEVGSRSLDDHFVELHVFGSLTAKSLKSVRIDVTGFKTADEALAKAIREVLQSHSITVDIQN